MRLRWKILIVVFLAGLWFLVEQMVSDRLERRVVPGAAAEKTVQQMTQRDLDAWYDWYNESFFLNQLPKNTEIRWADLTQNHDMGETFCDLEHKTCRILLDRETNRVPRTAQWTLVHELCHIKVPSGRELEHGPLFQQCMIDVAVRGGFRDIW